MTATTISAISCPAAYLPETREEPDMWAYLLGRETLRPSYVSSRLCPIYHPRGSGSLSISIESIDHGHSCGYEDPPRQVTAWASEKTVPVPSVRLVRSAHLIARSVGPAAPTRRWSRVRECRCYPARPVGRAPSTPATQRDREGHSTLCGKGDSVKTISDRGAPGAGTDTLAGHER
jgi:hypothetical protein